MTKLSLVYWVSLRFLWKFSKTYFCKQYMDFSKVFYVLLYKPVNSQDIHHFIITVLKKSMGGGGNIYTHTQKLVFHFKLPTGKARTRTSWEIFTPTASTVSRWGPQANWSWHDRRLSTKTFGFSLPPPPLLVVESASTSYNRCVI